MNQLADAGVLSRKPVGNQVQFQANSACPIYEDLRNMLKKTMGIVDVLRDALEPLADRVHAAFIYGSIARGDERAGSDLDVMILGEASFPEVVHALAGAREILRREINPNLYPTREFRKKAAAGDPFLKRVLADKKLFVIGDSNDLAQSASHRQAQSARRR